jgi:hypothetical protein
MAGPAGGVRVLKNEVKQLLIGNAKYYLLECHCDGFHTTVASSKTKVNTAWKFCQYVTDTCRYVKPEAIHIAEHRPVNRRLCLNSAWCRIRRDAERRLARRNTRRLQQTAGDSRRLSIWSASWPY